MNSVGSEQLLQSFQGALRPLHKVFTGHHDELTGVGAGQAVRQVQVDWNSANRRSIGRHGEGVCVTTISFYFDGDRNDVEKTGTSVSAEQCILSFF
jgi:hypothetical protein